MNLNLRFVLLIISALLVLLVANRCSEGAEVASTAVSNVNDFERTLVIGGIWLRLVHDLRTEKMMNRDPDRKDFSYLIKDQRDVYKSLKKSHDGSFVLVVNFGSHVDGFFVWTPPEKEDINYGIENWTCQAYGVKLNLLQEKLRNCTLVEEG